MMAFEENGPPTKALISKYSLKGVIILPGKAGLAGSLVGKPARKDWPFAFGPGALAPLN